MWEASVDIWIGEDVEIVGVTGGRRVLLDVPLIY